jgi:hypothetical protein
MQQVLELPEPLHVSPGLRHGMQVPAIPFALHVRPRYGQHSKLNGPISLQLAPCVRQQTLMKGLQYPLQH